MTEKSDVQSPNPLIILTHVKDDEVTAVKTCHLGFTDQTPTPTRFLRQCEEVGLFQEISLNPFDEQFRRASLLRSHHSITEVSFCLTLF